MDGVGAGAVAADGLVDELFRDVAVLAGGDQPAGDVPGVDVHDDVALVPAALDRALQRGHVPGPDLVGSVGDQFRAHPGRVGGQPAAFADLPGRAGDPVHRR